MLQIIYSSQARARLSDQTVDAILVTARRNNKTEGVSGMLLSGGGIFVQVLEGPETTVVKRYARILDDPRHSDCSIISIGPCQDPLFSEWAMAHVPGASLDAAEIAALRAFRQPVVAPAVLRGILRVFHQRLVAGVQQGANA